MNYFNHYADFCALNNFPQTFVQCSHKSIPMFIIAWERARLQWRTCEKGGQMRSNSVPGPLAGSIRRSFSPQIRFEGPGAQKRPPDAENQCWATSDPQPAPRGKEGARPSGGPPGERGTSKTSKQVKTYTYQTHICVAYIQKHV